uniref:Striatin N-terminal domain-containing protein n=1 Tax=Anabas testudineus TaxID=64144 RepID=A0A7N6AUG3_ANATE
MEADRSGGGPNPNSGGGSGAGRNPNGPKAAPGQATSAAATGAMAAAAAAATAAAAAAAMPGSSQPREPQDGDSGMTLPGILHFIQFEWGRFQAEKYRWEAERDELRAQVAFLQGERKGQENMKQDLVRRIKMLEYALKQERAKHQKLKTGNEQSPGDKKPETEADLRTCTQFENILLSTAVAAAAQLRVSFLFFLLIYLEEVGYSDTILDMRSKRVRSLLGRSSPESNGPPPSETCLEPEPQADPEDEEDEDDSEDALSEFDFLGSGEDGEGAGEARISGDGRELGMLLPYAAMFCQSAVVTLVLFHLHPAGGALGFSSDVFIMDAVGGGDMNLGELADLTVANDNDLSMDMQDNREEFKKTWNPRFTLRSHFDAIRALTFHPSQAVLLTASEDGTLKLWNLNKAMHSKKNAALDVEPIYTFRAHSGAVLSLTMGEDGESCYSGGLDGTIRCWKMPDLNVDPYDNYDPGIESSVLAGHEDSVWGLTYSAAHHRLASCSADGTIRIWDPQNSAPCMSVFNKEREHGTPTSVAFVATDPSQVVVSFDGGETLFYDLNTEQSVTALETQTKDGSELINRVVSHPSEPVSITAHENRTIRFLDNKTGKVVHSMVAHLDAVTCLTTDPKGTYLISGSHDCSVRLWMLDNRTCVQEITAHRKKHDEAIHDVAFHSSQPFIASAGADALAKIFV